ncbi:MAG: hypothetical protein ISS72_08600 [Candidatus Brocadiae bacterium]|nr:hypothetical protein [Candidatus Brocadiia bacterium]
MSRLPESLALPILFAKPGRGEVAVLSLSVVTKGAGGLPASIQGPLGFLDGALEPRNVGLLASLLPRLAGPDCYSATYEMPPKGVGQLADASLEGSSHLLSVILAMYALGADAVVRGEPTFQSKLEGWTASTFPNKQGKLKSVELLREKLAAVFRRNPALGKKGCPPISNVILAKDDRPHIAALLGTPAEDLAQAATLSKTQLLDAGLPDAAVGRADSAPVTLHFVVDFGSALELIFGAELLATYRRALRRHRLFRSKALWGGVLFLAAALAYLLYPRALPEDVKIEQDTCLQVYDRDGGRLWRRDMGVPVILAKLMRDRHGEARVVASLRPKGQDAGCLLIFDRRGERIARFDPGQMQPYRPDWPHKRIIKRVVIADLLPEPGQEIVAVGNANWFPSRVCILSEDGELLREYWHPGTVDGILHLAGTSRLVLWGPNNNLSLATEVEADASPYFFAIYCLDARAPSGQLPPYAAHDVPKQAPVWYKALSPKGRSILEVSIRNHGAGKLAELEVVSERGWTLYLNASGAVLRTAEQDKHRDPVSELIDVVPVQ